MALHANDTPWRHAIKKIYMYKSLNISQDIGLNADRNTYCLDLFQTTCIFLSYYHSSNCKLVKTKIAVIEVNNNN